MSQPSSARPPRIVSAMSRPPLRLWGWPLWGWLALVLAAVATLAYEGYMLPWLAFGVSAEHPAVKDVAVVRDASRGLTLTVLAPWTLASLVLRQRVRVIVTALVCTAPAIWFWWQVTEMH